MKPNAKIQSNDLIRMLLAEKKAENYRYRVQSESQLSVICTAGEALGPLILRERIGPKQFRLTGEAAYCRFKPGENIEIRAQRGASDFSRLIADWCRVDRVTYPVPGKVEVVISGERLHLDEGLSEMYLFKASSAFFKEKLITRIKAMNWNEIPIILGDEDQYSLSENHPKFRSLYDRLNNVQKMAVHHLIGNNLSGAIQGPPGTGKTQVLRAVVSLALSSNMKVCVASFTNAAVDNLLSRITKDADVVDWVRMGDSDRVRKSLYHKEVHSLGFTSNEFNEELNQCQLMGATLHKLAFNGKAPQFDLLVIDEAGQVPLYFWPFIQRLARRLVLVGDQFQLPPVLEAHHRGLPFDNIFSMFANQETPMLETQYRMRREIQEWSSEKFYRGKLKPDISVSNRDHFASSPAFVADGFVVPRKIPSGSYGTHSQGEANYITDKVERLYKTNGAVETIGIICPFRAQAAIVNASLQSRLGPQIASKILVDTVERFQGQEREAIFLSFGGCGSSEGSLKFLADAKRLNVAVTRAKSRFFCLFDEKLIERSRGKQSEDLHEFLGWVEGKKVKIRKAA